MFRQTALPVSGSSKRPMLIPAVPFCHFACKTQNPAPIGYPEELVTLGDHLKARRLDLGLLQKDVARLLNAHVHSVINWEQNRCEPSLKYIPRIIEFLGYAPMSLIPHDWGGRIKFCRKINGLSQKDLARQLGINPSTLAKWEQDKRLPCKETVERLTNLQASLSPGSALPQILQAILEKGPASKIQESLVK
jgi:transcriptional regulator with XRE-family HTH domain